MALGRRLNGLRSQLRGSHNILGGLWELVTLHTALQLGKGVDHEPSEGRPDVQVDLPSTGRFWIEATHVAWPEREASETIAQFIAWVRVELKRRHAVEPNLYEIRVDPPSLHKETVIPAEHTWAHLRRTPEWRAFAEEVKRNATRAVVGELPSPFSARVTIQRYEKPSRYLSSGYLSPKAIKRISDHPVWSALRTKAEQARGWKLPDPLVVCIGSSLSVSLFDSMQAFAPGPEAAVAGALYDTSKWHGIHQHNILRDTSGECYQVLGADRVSAVVLVSIEDRKELPWYRQDHNRIARTKVILNDKARYTLTESQLQLSPMAAERVTGDRFRVPAFLARRLSLGSPAVDLAAGVEHAAHNSVRSSVLVRSRFAWRVVGLCD